MQNEFSRMPIKTPQLIGTRGMLRHVLPLSTQWAKWIRKEIVSLSKRGHMDNVRRNNSSLFSHNKPVLQLWEVTIWPRYIRKVARVGPCQPATSGTARARPTISSRLVILQWPSHSQTSNLSHVEMIRIEKKLTRTQLTIDSKLGFGFRSFTECMP